MKTLIKNAFIVNEGDIIKSDILIKEQLIEDVNKNINVKAEKIIDAEGLYLMPGIIDDQVHFREP